MSETQKKRILVAVTGSTPQILTETIYALNAERGWIPDEVHVLTTTHGRDEIKKYLLDGGAFKALCDTYHLQDIEFTEKSIHVIEDAEGKVLSDIKSIDDNERAANMIVHFIHDLCADDNNEIHVSLAGGRKSMGFYIGYALSLFGRQQDSMSHVLVSHPYEHAKAFFFPTLVTNNVKFSYKQNGETYSGEVDAKDAQIWLSDIPFVRMGSGIPNLNLTDGWEYKDAVALAQKSFEDYTVEINLREKKLICNGSIDVALPPQQLAFYAAIASLSKEGRVASAKYEKVQDACSVEEFVDLYVHYYDQVKGKMSADRESLLKEIGDEPDIYYKLSPALSRIENALNEKLGSISKYFEVKSYGEKLALYYQVDLAPENITIVE